MATHKIHTNKEVFYFITFTCYKWLPLIDQTSLYNYVKSWADQLAKRGIKLSGYVLMPNHIHLLVYLEDSCKGLNLVIGEAKRFMAYEIVKRLKTQNAHETLKILSEGVQKEEKTKGKKHQVFRLSFDAKEVVGEMNIIKVLSYIHHNPVSGKWNLVDDYVHYPYSSAQYYELGKQNEIKVWDYRNEISESSTSDSEGS